MKTPQELAEYKRAWRRERAARTPAEAGTLEFQIMESIRKMICESGMAVYKVAELSGVSYTLVYGILNGKQPATAYAAERIAKALGYRWGVTLERVEV